MLCVFFCLRFDNSILLQLLILDPSTLEKTDKGILRHHLFGDKTIKNGTSKISP